MKYKFNVLKLNEEDNVVVALRSLKVGESLSLQGLEEKIYVKEKIPYGHKISLTKIEEGAPIIKYGECMGISTEEIPIGSHVHISNVRGLNENERLNIVNKSMSL